MYRRIDDFIADWKMEDVMTSRIFSAVKEGSQHEIVHEHIRSLGFLAWHIIQTMRSVAIQTGLFDNSDEQEGETPATMAGILDSYMSLSSKIADAVQSKWLNSDLEDEIQLFGRPFKKGKVLAILIDHGAHHRSQMTILMRLQGMKVPGIYGPAREEWEAMGMAPQA